MGIFIDTLLNDTRYALRHFRRSPGFTFAAIATLALSLGATTAMFAVMDALTFRRLAIADPDSLLSLSSYDARGTKRYVPMPTVINLNAQGPFREACGYNGGGTFPMIANGIPTQGTAAFVTGRCFSVFGVAPILGRTIDDGDAPILTAGAKVVVISDRLWARLFNRDPAVIGKTLKVESAVATIIGILPPEFRGIHADSGIDVFAPPDSLIPATQGRRPVAQEVLGRLKPGITFEQAEAQFQTMWPALLAQARDANRNANEGNAILGSVVRLDRMGKGLSPTRDQHEYAIALILGLSAMFLILACVNLGGLLLTRLDARGNELAIRLAIGGSRGRVVQQILVESLLLAAGGTVLGAFVAFAFAAQIPSFLNPGFVGWERSFTPDARVLALGGGLGIGVALLLTAVPACFMLRRPVGLAFTWSRTATGTAGRWTRGLVATQIALSVVMLIGAALLIRSLYEIQNNDPGVRTDGILTARLMAMPDGMRGVNSQPHYAALLDKLRQIPGVVNIAYASVFPRRLSLIASDVGFVGEDFTGVQTGLDSVSVNFFDMMGVRLLAGRAFTEGDTARSQRVVIVSESLARALAPDGNLLNRRLRFATNRAMQDLTVVGVVANATQGNLKHTAAHVMYSPAAQATAFSGPNLLLEIRSDAAPIADAVRRVVLEHGREFVFDIAMVDELLARGPARERMSATLSAVIASLAAAIAAIGIYAVLASSVARRRRELGVRIAVGARPQALAMSIIRDGVLVTTTGVVLGTAVAYFAARLVRSLVFGISETDPIAFVGVAVFVLLLGIGAGLLPARRAATVDPVIALRAD